MHSLIETYLNRVEARLRRLAPDEREQQMQEISLHLQSIIAEKQSLGLSKTEAIQVALSQFGEPSQIGRDIEQQVTVGHKTSHVKGLLVGAAAGLCVLVFWGLFSLEDGTIHLATIADIAHVGLGSFTEKLIEAAFGGAVASLVGRRLTWRYLSRPARSWPLFTAFSQVGTVAFRTMGAGILRGAVGGAIFGFINAVLALLDPHSTVASAQEMMVDLVAISLSYSIGISALIGFVAALIGALRQRFGHRVPRQWA